MSDLCKGKTVLVVDDQASFREAVMFEFEMLGCQTVGAENGQDALNKFKANKIDLVISDIRMPVWDGPKFLNELRKISQKNPPFIFMTGFSDLKLYDAFNWGADSFIGKPINPDNLLSILGSLLIPSNDKWKSPTAATPAVKLTFELPVYPTEQLQLGRSGFFISSTLHPSISDLAQGSIIEFDLSFLKGPISSLQGTGTVVWRRTEDSGELINGYGIQFNYLKESCRTKVLAYLDSLDDVSSIPRGTAASTASPL